MRAYDDDWPWLSDPTLDCTGLSCYFQPLSICLDASTGDEVDAKKLVEEQIIRMVRWPKRRPHALSSLALIPVSNASLLVGDFLRKIVLSFSFFLRPPKDPDHKVQGMDEGGDNANIGIFVPDQWHDKGQFWFRSHALWNVLQLNSVRETQLREMR